MTDAEKLCLEACADECVEFLENVKDEKPEDFQEKIDEITEMYNPIKERY